jgi:hypothetical protein
MECVLVNPFGIIKNSTMDKHGMSIRASNPEIAILSGLLPGAPALFGHVHENV